MVRKITLKKKADIALMRAADYTKEEIAEEMGVSSADFLLQGITILKMLDSDPFPQSRRGGRTACRTGGT